MKQSLFDHGYSNEQFLRLEELQDDANPNVVEEVVTLYYRGSVRPLQNLDQAIIVANKAKIESTKLRDHCRVGNVEGCKRAFQHMKKEHVALKKKLEEYFPLAHQWHVGASEARGMALHGGFSSLQF